MVIVSRIARAIARPIVRQNGQRTAPKNETREVVRRTLLKTGLESSDAYRLKLNIRQVTWRGIPQTKTRQSGCCPYVMHVGAKRNSATWNDQRQANQMIVIVISLGTGPQTQRADHHLGITHVTALGIRDGLPAKLSIPHNLNWDQQKVTGALNVTTARVTVIWPKTAPRLVGAATRRAHVTAARRREEGVVAAPRDSPAWLSGQKIRPTTLRL